jgi:hypothetical protein
MYCIVKNIKGLLEKSYTKGNLEVTGATTTFCLKRRV